MQIDKQLCCYYSSADPAELVLAVVVVCIGVRQVQNQHHQKRNLVEQLKIVLNIGTHVASVQNLPKAHLD